MRKIAINVKLPKKLNYDRDYYKGLKQELNKYLNLINGIDEIDLDTKEKTKDNIKLIMESLDYYYEANIEKAKSSILKIIEKYKKMNL